MTQRSDASPNLIIITGPTAVGKTAVAVELARIFNTEIISADSMQVYTHLSIGTAKPTREELGGIPCHLIDYVSPNDQYNLGRFLRDAEPVIARLHANGKLPIVCGGTGLYLRGLLYGVFDGGGANEEVRADLERRFRHEGLSPLYAELMRIDRGATHIMPNDRQRILRALEVYYTTGKPITALQNQRSAPPRYNALTVVLTRPREELYAQINSRVDAMLKCGLLDEVRAYLDSGFSRDNPAVRALGYAELIAHLEVEMALADAVAAMKQKSRNYAKRQQTWFRAMRDAHTLDVSGRDIASVCKQITGNIAGLESTRLFHL